MKQNEIEFIDITCWYFCKKRPEKLMHGRAYTYLKQLVGEIRTYGKYAFWNNEEKQKRYLSEYGRRKHTKNNETETSVVQGIKIFRQAHNDPKILLFGQPHFFTPVFR
ncbi:hypothetical protein GQR60_19570 [Labilibaculum sp. A4]|uniref:hypothetical protein n=1 Tax=Labilibaculum euxinus TaxID=2686357 RepID=UPI000F616747|nr:hypothetical protein [Labilibaculum euxinus]MDQ1771616.1 hypothetical protein [Labilibaculum euxinus]MWN78537.1 hypothetical protein [Labilibaculum euxinus]